MRRCAITWNMSYWFTETKGQKQVTDASRTPTQSGQQYCEEGNVANPTEMLAARSVPCVRAQPAKVIDRDGSMGDDSSTTTIRPDRRGSEALVRLDI